MPRCALLPMTLASDCVRNTQAVILLLHTNTHKEYTCTAPVRGVQHESLPFKSNENAGTYLSQQHGLEALPFNWSEIEMPVVRRWGLAVCSFRWKQTEHRNTTHAGYIPSRVRLRAVPAVVLLLCRRRLLGGFCFFLILLLLVTSPWRRRRDLLTLACHLFVAYSSPKTIDPPRGFRRDFCVESAFARGVVCAPSLSQTSIWAPPS
jgi:hypothetical protein